MKTIKLRTEIPGPKSQALMARREAAIPRGPYHATPIFAARSEAPSSKTSTAIAISILLAASAASTPAIARKKSIPPSARSSKNICTSAFSVTPYEGYVAVAEKAEIPLPPAN
jgi:4-aminobutyrate aminotransferase/(S)-3-amino-2-methylpropionate transaminase